MLRLSLLRFSKNESVTIPLALYYIADNGKQDLASALSN
ncbi:hypothetical protein KsCSTR_37860 [Candidatus Kuenenia stuttgartiensis]|uniref:Uncharacterized protein n=1 Tax=Kuenenia stuttgartiensis TaxID=174633 RepID=A0A6G7GUH7_KUEST|nr:hypothetical protein KsCSTR_37860 [Candidatus Kuenenia stuttgartiensis]